MTTTALALIAAWLAGAAAQEVPKPQKEHEWLQQFSGEWDTDGEFLIEPGKPPIRSKGSESSRMIGGFWYQSEHKGEFMGAPFTGLLTVGFSPEKKKYVGTWVDSMTSHLWTYQGSVDAAGKILTLEAEGPGHEPGKLTKFRETVTIKDKDHKEFASSMEKDGQWITFAKVQYTRKK